MKEKEKKEVRARREVVIAPPEETAAIKFRDGGAMSPYRDLLEELQDAPKGSTLKIARAARYTAVKHIRDLGLAVKWGRDPQQPDVLYIKIVGTAEPPLTIERAVQKAAAERPAVPPVLPQLPGRLSAEQTLLLSTLKKKGPATLKELSRVLGVTAVACAAVLTVLGDQGRVEIEEGVYRIKTAA
jgi:hypothetical protein